MSAPFRAGHQPVSDQLCADHPAEVPVLRPPVSCCLSAVGLGLLGHPAPAGSLSLPHGRPTGHHVTGPQRGCRVAHEQAATGQGALFIPGDGGALPALYHLPARTCRSSTASPYGPGGTSHRRGALSRDVSESSRYSPITPGPAGYRPRAGNPACRLPPVFSSPAAPGWNTGRFGFYPGLRTPRLPAAHARAETGHHALARVLHPRPQPGLQRCLPLELMHPHVARISAGVLIFVNELLPTVDETTELRRQVRSAPADTDVLPQDEDAQRLDAWRGRTSGRLILSEEFRYERALLVVPVTQTLIDQACTSSTRPRRKSRHLWLLNPQRPGLRSLVLLREPEVVQVRHHSTHPRSG